MSPLQLNMTKPNGLEGKAKVQLWEIEFTQTAKVEATSKEEALEKALDEKAASLDSVTVLSVEDIETD